MLRTSTAKIVLEREVLSIHIGQAGIQMGSACWERYTIEHGISPDGILKPELEPCGDGESFQTFFNHTPSGRYVPRSLMVDLEPSAIDEIRSNQYSDLFHPEFLINGTEDASNNFARGYHTLGREMIYTIIEKITKLVDSCPSLAGFIVYHSLGGGTGSGLTSLVMEHLSEEYPKKSKIEFNVYPSPKLNTAVVEPYNSILVTHHTLECSDCAFLIDNEATYEICARDLDIGKPTYLHVNRLSADIISCITASLRFGGSINVDLREFQTNLVPYPRIHYPLVSYSPLLTEVSRSHRKNSIQDITLECFRPFNQFVKCDPRHGKYMACCLLYRGLIPPREISSAINMLKDRELITFVNWCPTGFKVGINYQTATQIPCSDITNSEQSLCMLANNTCISEAWARLDYHFDLMYAKRAYIHWYLGEGMDEAEFIDARENLAELELEYSDCGMDTIDEGTIVEDEDTRRKTTPTSETKSLLKV